MARRDTGKERQWRGALGEQRQSGLSVRAFCARRGLTESAFYFWRRELVRRDREVAAVGVKRLMRRRSQTRFQPAAVDRDETPTLVPLTVIPHGTGGTGPLELALPSGVVLRIHADAPWELVGRLLEALGANHAKNEERRPC